MAMNILAIDTSANLCAACLYDAKAQKVLGKAGHNIGRGHAEHLLAIIDEALAEATASFDVIERVAVCVGPGSFTGIRVGVAAARALGLALEKPVVGITTFEALAFDYVAADKPSDPFAVALRGGRGQIFAQGFEANGDACGAPFVLKGVEETPIIDAKFRALIGNAACDIDTLRMVENRDGATGTIHAFAALGSSSTLEPKPLYLRSADAKIAGGFALPRKAENAS